VARVLLNWLLFSLRRRHRVLGGGELQRHAQWGDPRSYFFKNLFFRLKTELGVDLGTLESFVLYFRSILAKICQS
jgi:hypothetical protein